MLLGSFPSRPDPTPFVRACRSRYPFHHSVGIYVGILYHICGGVVVACVHNSFASSMGVVSSSPTRYQNLPVVCPPPPPQSLIFPAGGCTQRPSFLFLLRAVFGAVVHPDSQRPHLSRLSPPPSDGACLVGSTPPCPYIEVLSEQSQNMCRIECCCTELFVPRK